MTDPVERYAGDAFLAPGSGASVQRPDLSDVPLHWHDYYELCLVVDGTAGHVVNGRRTTVGPGSAFLLSPADLHALEVADDGVLRCYNAVIAPDLVERVLGRLGGVPHGFPWQADGLAHLAGDLVRLHDEQRQARTGREALTEALVTSLVVELARTSREPASETGDGTGPAAAADPGAGADDLRRALLYVDRNFREPLSLADVAAQAHLSPNYFSERFRDRTGTSFQDYLQARRLGFARSLLASTTMSVTEVCHAAGFGDVSHFGRLYRRRYGEPPSARGRGARRAPPWVGSAAEPGVASGLPSEDRTKGHEVTAITRIH